MIKQTITFEDFDGNEHTEDFYFHLSKAELIAMEAGEESMSDKLKRISASGNGGEIMRIFSSIVEAAYGERVDNDPRKFFKSPEKSREFMQSPAYDVFLVTLLTSESTAIDFINGVMPKDLVASPEVIKAVAEARGEEVVELPQPAQPTFSDQSSGLTRSRNEKGVLLPWAFREPTPKEMTGMTPEQLRDVYTRKASGWKPPQNVA